MGWLRKDSEKQSDRSWALQIMPETAGEAMWRCVKKEGFHAL
jgi:hypothetical protein